jgi:ubiquinone/menaquinone biosynthesis C-methylase UbiE
MSVEFHPDAQQELEDAVAYYDGISSEIGDAFITGVKSTLQRIEQFPEAWSYFTTEKEQLTIMQNWPQLINQYINESTLEERKSWYSNAADAYNRTRPRYPDEIISRVLELAQLPPNANILELGCGPGTATTSFAKLGSITCLEPSSEACEIARQNCTNYPNVEIINTTFEEWELTNLTFDAVLAATSIHWISKEIRYIKTANALKPNGSLILLWNTASKPQDEVYQILHEIYQRETPSLAEKLHPGKENHLSELGKFGQAILDSGLYHNLTSEHFPYELTYSINDYLALLGTFSPCIALEPQQRNSLFTSLKQTLLSNWGKSFQVPCIASFHIAEKV